PPHAQQIAAGRIPCRPADLDVPAELLAQRPHLLRLDPLLRHRDNPRRRARPPPADTASSLAAGAGGSPRPRPSSHCHGAASRALGTARTISADAVPFASSRRNASTLPSADQLCSTTAAGERAGRCNTTS